MTNSLSIKPKFDLTFLGISLLLWVALEVVFVMLGLKPTAFLLFTLLLIIAVFIPGFVLITWLKLDLTPINRFALAWISGYPLTTTIYFLARYFQAEWLYALFLAVIFLSLILTKQFKFVLPVLGWKEHGTFYVQLLVLFIVGLTVCGLASFGNGQQADGSFRLVSLYPIDFMYHITLVTELSNFFPPQIPFAASFPLIYHFFPDLFAALFIRVIGLDVWDLLGSFLPVFYFSAFFLSLILFTKEIGCSKSTILLVIILICFGSNLAFFTNALGFFNAEISPVLEFQFVPSFMMLHINPMIIGLTFLFAGTFALSRFQAEGRIGWLVLCLLLFLSTTFFKIFVAVLLVAGLGMLIVFDWLKTKRISYSLVGIILPLILAILFMVKLSPARGESTLKFQPGYLSVRTLTTSGVFPSTVEGVQSLKNAWQQKKLSYLLKIGLLGGVFWFVGSFGPRILGLFFSSRFLLVDQGGWALTLLSWMCWAGTILGTLFVLPPEDVNINHFFMISLYLAALFTALFIGGLLVATKKRVFVLITIAAVLPTSLYMLAYRPLGFIPPVYNQAANYLKNSTPVDTIVAYPFDNQVYAALMPLSGRRAMYLRYYMIHNRIGIALERKLAQAGYVLYNAKDSRVLKAIIKRYQVDYIVEDSAQQVSLPEKDLQTVFSNEVITIRKRTGTF